MDFILKSALRRGAVLAAAVWRVAASCSTTCRRRRFTRRRGRATSRRFGALVKAGADINAPDALGGTPLHWAARGGHAIGPHRCHGEAADRPAVIAALLDLGANPNLRDRRPRIPGASSGWTPLFVALHHEQFQTAAVLLEHGADPNIRSDQGMSVMEVASAEGAPRDLIELILAKGFDPQLAR